MLLNLITHRPDPSQTPTCTLSFVCHLHRLTCPTYKGGASMLLCFCRPLQHPIRTILGLSPLSVPLGLSKHYRRVIAYSIVQEEKRHCKRIMSHRPNTLVRTVLLSNYKEASPWTTKVCSKSELKPMISLNSTAFSYLLADAFLNCLTARTRRR